MITFGSDVGDIILQRTLSENTQGLSLAIERMTSGYKVNHAKDNAAGYSIITDLNTKISSMLQVQQNTEDGIAMLQTAEGGLEEIQGLLERLRALAQQASNGSYGADERESMQAEADEIIAEIARIRDTIQYNGMNLYETPRNEDIVTTSLNRLSASANITNAGEIYPKKTNNDTQSSPVAFTLAVGGGVNTLASSSSVSLLSNDTIEGAVDLGATETKTINIDGVEYTIRNRNSTANSISYTKDTVTGELTFLGSDFTIRVQSDVAHNVSINGSRIYFYGGDLNDKINFISGQNNEIHAGDGDDEIILNAGTTVIYGEAGDDIIRINVNPTAGIYGGDGNDTFYLLGATSYTQIYGGNGDDVFNIENGNNWVIYGEEGNDSFNITKSSSTGITIDGGSGTNNFSGNLDGNVVANVIGANAYIDTISANSSKSININGIDYTVTNNSTTDNSLIYMIDDSGKITFQSTVQQQLIIRGDVNKAHNVDLASSRLVFYGGNLDDTITNSRSDVILFMV